MPCSKCRTARHYGAGRNTRFCSFYTTLGRVSPKQTQLKVGDLGVGGRDGRHALVTLHGKGGKIRQCPLLPDIERVLAEQVGAY